MGAAGHAAGQTGKLCHLDAVAVVGGAAHDAPQSSHITSDLEKIADYITFIDNGRVLMSKPKDELIYEYGIARCKESQFLQMDQSEILTYRKQEYQYEVLVDHKEQIKRKYPDMVVDHATLDEIMLLYIKGERK